MGRLRADAMALACIVGGATVSGLATYGMMSGNHDTPEDVECAVVDGVSTRAGVVVALGGDREAIVVAPNVRLHQPHCVAVASFNWRADHEHARDGARVRMEQARLEMELARQMMETRVIELEGLDVELKSIGLDLQLGKQISESVERSLQEEMDRLEREVARINGEIVR